MRVVTRTIEAIAVAMALWVTTASAEESTAARSRATIEQQFDAFARDDAEAAYALADPTIQQMFVDADRFLAMVRDRYPPVYRHRSVEFGVFPAAGFHIFGEFLAIYADLPREHAIRLQL